MNFFENVESFWNFWKLFEKLGIFGSFGNVFRKPLNFCKLVEQYLQRFFNKFAVKCCPTLIDRILNKQNSQIKFIQHS